MHGILKIIRVKMVMRINKLHVGNNTKTYLNWVVNKMLRKKVRGKKGLKALILEIVRVESRQWYNYSSS